MDLNPPFHPYLHSPGDAWTVPAAGAVMFALVVCALPFKDGKPLRNLTIDPVSLSLTTRFCPELCFTRVEDSVDDEWELVSSNDGDAAGAQSSEFDDSTTLMLGGGPRATPDIDSDGDDCCDDSFPERVSICSTTVIMVSHDKDESDCHTCCLCESKIEAGTCLASFQYNERPKVFHLHPACVASFTVSRGIVGCMLGALIEHQPLCETRCHSVINLMISEIIDRSRLFCGSIGSGSGSF